MAMNRQTKRMLQRQGSLHSDGTPMQTVRERAGTRAKPQKEERTRPAEFLRDVRGELRKVAWPTRGEVVHYSIIVLIAVVVLTTIIAGLDWVFGEFVLRLFQT